MKSKALNFVLIVFLLSCSSYKYFRYYERELETPTQIFHATYIQTWKAVVQVMKKYSLQLKSRDNGVIRTNWIDNTKEINFSDYFGKYNTVKGAKFKLIVNVIKGYRSGRESTKVTISKKQMIERGFLQGWKLIYTDGILEKTLLYRIERILAIEKKLQKIEDDVQKTENEPIDSL